EAALCELRLLAVRKDFRHTHVARDLLLKTIELCLLRGYAYAVISGTLRQVKLYKNLGFEPFGPVVGTQEAPYQPMFLARETVLARFPQLVKKNHHLPSEGKVLLQPGPVPIHPDVQRQFQLPAISHRSEVFKQVLSDLNITLRKLAKAEHVQ